jgi:hypothetical protein
LLAELCELQGLFDAGDGASAREGNRLELGVVFFVVVLTFLVSPEAAFKGRK